MSSRTFHALGPVRVVRLDETGRPVGTVIELTEADFDFVRDYPGDGPRLSDVVALLSGGTIASFEIPLRQVSGESIRFLRGYRHPPFLRWFR